MARFCHFKSDHAWLTWFLSVIKIDGFVNEGRALHAIYCNFRKIFQCYLQKCSYIQVQVLWSGWADKSRLNAEFQSIVVNESCLTWRPVTTAVVQGSTILGPPFIRDLREVMEPTLIRWEGDTKLEGPVNTVRRWRLPAAGWQKSCEIQKGQIQHAAPGIIPDFSAGWGLPGQRTALLRSTSQSLPGSQAGQQYPRLYQQQPGQQTAQHLLVLLYEMGLRDWGYFSPEMWWLWGHITSSLPLLRRSSRRQSQALPSSV